MILFAACTDPTAPPLDELDAKTFPVQHLDDQTGKISTLQGHLAQPPGDDPFDDTWAFLVRHADAFGLRSDLSDLVLVRADHDLGGTTYAWNQLHDGALVFDAGLVVGLDPTNAIIHVRNAYEPNLAVATQPVVTAVEAITKAEAALAQPIVTRAAAPVLVVVHGDKRAPGVHLAWLVTADVRKPRGDFRVFVDATSGDIVRVIDMLKHVGPSCIACNPATDTACGRIFDHNAVEFFNNPSLTDTSNVDNAMVGCKLNNLTSTTNLTGIYINTSITAAPRVAPPYNFLRSANQNGVDEVNMYYHLNRSKERLNSIGFSNVMNFSINADARDPTLGDNSHYVPSGKYLEFGVGGVDDAQDPDVMYHEYGHAIQDNQVPGYGSSEEGGAAGEGFGDYWASTNTDELAATLLGTGCVAAYDAVSYNPYTGAAGSGCLRRVDGTKQYPRDLDFEVHDDGEMWSAALWRLRGVLGPAVADPLVIKSHTFLLPTAKFVDLATALVSADNALNGGANVAAIHSAMKAQGIPRTGTPATVTTWTASATFSCATAHPYANLAYKECTFTQPGATKVRIHFTAFNTESGYDYVYVSDANYLQVQALTGQPFASFTNGTSYSAAVTGDTIVIRFKADGSVTKNGVTIDQAQYLAAPAGCTTDAQCNDGNACNGAETCNVGTGACVAGTAPNCNDGNACSTDSCVPATGCVNTAITCNDNSACTADSCNVLTGCVYVPLTCDDSNACTANACNPATGCAYTPTSCDDSNACTADACDIANGCAHAPIACDDGNACTTDSCDTATGCTHTATACDDGNACTTDSCDPVLGCTHAPITCDDGNGCSADSCDPALGCVYSAVADGTTCGAAVCGTAPTCQQGACVGQGASCDDGNPCTIDGCDGDTGGCTHTAVTDGTSCGDTNACNGNETCQAGACTAGAPLDCNDGNACTLNTCDPLLGCVAVGVGCDDNNGCTADSCDAATGCVNTAVSCDDGNACTAESCDPVLGCRHSAIACDDGNACTASSCDPVMGCVATPISCDDGNACTAETCDPVLGCAHTPISCNDGNACTADTCDPVDGCVATPVSCDDGNPCTTDSCNPASGCTHTVTCTLQTLASDGFESNNFTGGTGWTGGGWTISLSSNVTIQTTNGPNTGTHHVRLRNANTSIKRGVSLVGASSVHLHFAAKVNSFEANDRADIQVSTDGVNFTTVKSFTAANSDNIYHTYDVDLSAFVSTSTFKIQFKTGTTNGSNDNWYLDDISVTGNR